MMVLENKAMFHVHTFRCGHAEMVSDEAYVCHALELGADGIWFSDHAPFPGDPFGNRMSIHTLPEYLHTLQNLKEKYKDQIAVHIGLEIEYFPSFCSYYKELKRMSELEFLLLGQHMAELTPGVYSFSKDHIWQEENEYKALGKAMIAGMKTGWFDAVAHPDRIFRKQKAWTKDMQKMSEKIIQTAKNFNLPLEQNEESRQKHLYRPEFWKLAEESSIIHGLDAHSVSQLKLI